MSVTVTITPDGRRRLARLVDLLESDPASWPLAPNYERPKFNLQEWIGQLGDYEIVCRLRPTSAKTDCGTTCCAAGLAALDPWFRAEGLRPLPSGNLSFSPAGSADEDDGWLAVSRCFGLPPDDGFVLGFDPFDEDLVGCWDQRGISPDDVPLVHRLFLDDCYPPADRTNPRAVAARIRRLLAGDPLADWHTAPSFTEQAMG